MISIELAICDVDDVIELYNILAQIKEMIGHDD
jgi:hypothetical protein